MAEDSSNTGVFGLLRTGLDISLGAAHKSIEMARNPPETAARLISDMVSLFTVPASAGPNIQDKAQAVAGVWMEKGMTLLAECKVAGEKYRQTPESPDHPKSR